MQIIYPLKLIFSDKKTNSIGLQMADLIAYPIGRFLINPEQKNLSFEILEKKFYGYPEYQGRGFKMLSYFEPSKKRKTSEFSEVSAD